MIKELKILAALGGCPQRGYFSKLGLTPADKMTNLLVALFSLKMVSKTKI